MGEYDYRDQLESPRLITRMVVPGDYVKWSRFFEINGSSPNLSRRIGPHLSDGLGNDQIFPAFDETARVGLLYRDLLGAGLAGVAELDGERVRIVRTSLHDPGGDARRVECGDGPLWIVASDPL